jgi:hypothetical protein
VTASASTARSKTVRIAKTGTAAAEATVVVGSAVTANHWSTVLIDSSRN